jgi:hypothetical protein
MQIIYWLKYVLLLPFFILMRLSTYPLAPIAVTFFSTRDRLSLLPPFEWMMTDDNWLVGDEHWRRIITGDPLSLKNRIGWMWRNGGHHASYFLFGCPRPSAYPTHRTFTPLLGLYLEVYLGWSGNEPRGKYVLTMRWRDRNY